MPWTRFFRRRRWDEERRREVEVYLELETADNLARGMSAVEAASAARRKLGSPTLIREEIYRMNTIGLVETMWGDLRYAGRVLRKAPGFAAAVIAILALGIGANTTIFSVVNAVLLRPLPFPASDRLVRIFHVPPQQQFPGVTKFSVSPANYLDWKRQSHTFEAMAAYAVRNHNLTGGDRPEAIALGHVPPEFFDIVGLHPFIGRVFSPEEDRPAGAHVAVIANSFWRTHLGAVPDVIGRTVQLDRQPYTIVGVMPPAMEYASWGVTAVKIWVPLAWDDSERAIRGLHNYQVVARLAPGATLRLARSELDAVSATLARLYPADDAGWGATAMTLQELVVGDVRTSLLVLLGAVGFVLLIACANVANLCLARMLGRGKEIALRCALGAGRGRILRQLLTETVLLSVAGGAAGLVLARAGLRLVAMLVADQLPRADELSIDGAVLAFTAAISLATGIGAGLIPALRGRRTDLNEALKQGLGRTESQAGGPLTRNLLVIVEVALSLMLLIGAGLMIRTLWFLRRVNPGFDPHGVMTMTVSIPQSKYDTPARSTAFFDELLRRVRALPGVDSAAVIDSVPISGGGPIQPIVIEGRPSGAMSEQPEMAVRQSSPGYLRTMRIPLLRGRDFRERDTRAVLISESVAKRFWPGQDPLGARIRFTLVDKEAVWEIVGVVGDIKDIGLAAETPETMVYQWTRERPMRYLNLVVRTANDPASVVQPATAVIRQIDAEQPVRNVSSMDDLIAASLANDRFNMRLLGAFAAMAVSLAAIGIYSLLSYAVRRRRREIGIRTALGADVYDVVRMILIEGLKPALIGVAIGILGALFITRILSRLVHGVSPTDPVTFALVAAGVLCISLVSCVAPALRAARVDPLGALRDE
jgi:predicted permease